MDSASKFGVFQKKTRNLAPGASCFESSPRLRIVVRAHVVVTCVKSKHGIPDVIAQIRDLETGPSDAVAVDWLARLSHAVGGTPARALYKGLAWSYVRRAEKSCPEASFQVASAGYGLVSFDHCMGPYNASFSPGPDQVAAKLAMEGSTQDRHRRWWYDLNELRRGSGAPISELVEGPVIVIAGSHYLDALQDDLCKAARVLGPSGLLVVVVGGKGLPDELDACVLRVPISARTLLGTPLSALAAKLLVWLCQDVARAAQWSIPEIKRVASSRLSQVPEPSATNRVRLADGEVIYWISERIRAGDAKSCSALLRELRDSGLACEQGRFRSLFKQASSTAEGF